MMKENPLPVIAPDICPDDPITDDEIATAKARDILERLNEAVKAKDAGKLEGCFFSQQAYWRDQIALTWHLRTFSNSEAIAASLLETSDLRGLAGGGFTIEGQAHFIPDLNRTQQAIAFPFRFSTRSPGATCSGRAMLLPSEEKQDAGNSVKRVTWKIWVLCTWIEQLDLHAEDEALLKLPGKKLDSLETIETDVVIIGGGNSAVATAARLKALGVESVMIERNARAGDNWALRYDCLAFHIMTAVCELPYSRYAAELQFPHMLTKDELAGHVRHYVKTFNLNVINSARVTDTRYNTKTKWWTVAIKTPDRETKVVCKHLVQATGFGSQKPYMPPMWSPDLYKGISMHSAEYKNAKELIAKGANSVLIVGSANTAFDITVDAHAAGLRTTMATRSPTYLLPVEYMARPETLGAYARLGPEAADRQFQTGPAVVDGALVQDVVGRMARAEPRRYERLEATGFPVWDSAAPGAVLNHNLYERAGGHYVDVGGTKLLADGEVGVKVGEPVAFHEHGLTFLDGSSVDVDAVVWCTGYADKNARDTAAEILGGGGVDGGPAAQFDEKDILGPNGIASRIDATWGLDAEGEIRGLAKRQLRVENYWAIGGPANTSRWYSKLLAIQIKAALEGVLPPAYRGTPGRGQ
ncbi:monooxygenase [Apiospora aurea]|uniref:Monooxygenase n=1 Tax=Apiospora aurea TaxID=335848 RepID=A0ABR1QAX9_9PEZI